MSRTIIISERLTAEIQSIIDETHIPFEDFVHQALMAYLQAWKRRKLQTQLEQEYEDLAAMYDELAAELADETWLPLENETLLHFEQNLEP